MVLDIEWSLTLKKFALISGVGDPTKGDDFVLLLLLLLLLLFVTSSYVKQAGLHSTPKFNAYRL